MTNGYDKYFYCRLLYTAYNPQGNPFSIWYDMSQSTGIFPCLFAALYIMDSSDRPQSATPANLLAASVTSELLIHIVFHCKEYLVKQSHLTQ